MKRLKITWLLLGLAVISLVLTLVYYQTNKFTLPQIASNLCKDIQALKTNCVSQNLLLLDDTEATKNFRNSNYSSYLFKNDSLVEWFGSEPESIFNHKVFNKNQGILTLKSGFYIYFKNTSKNLCAVSISKIKSNYSLQNNYLQNQFAAWLNVPAQIEIEFKNNEQTKVVLDGITLFSLKGTERNYLSESVSSWCSVFFYLSLILFLAAGLLYFQKNYSKLGLLLSLILPIVLKFVLTFYTPGFLLQTQLYNVQLFSNAQSQLNYYLNDIFLNSIFLIYFALLATLLISLTLTKNATWFFHILVIFIATFQFNHSVKSLITNSTLNFDFLSVFNIKATAWLALATLILNMLAVIVLSNNLLKLVLINFKNTAINFISLAGLCFFVYFFDTNLKWYIVLWPLILLSLIYAFHFLAIKNNAFVIGAQLMLASALLTGILNFYISKNKVLDFEFLSYKLNERQDISLPSEYEPLIDKFKADEKLKNLINVLPMSGEALKQYLKQTYFGGYFNKYDVEFSMFDKDCTPLLETTQSIFLNEGFFLDQMQYQSDTSFSKKIFFIEKHKENARYIAQVNIDDKKLFVLLEPKQFEDLGSFPDLFLDQSQQRPEKQKYITYAVYRNKQTTTRYGDFNYPFLLSDSSTLASTNKSYNHYYFYPEESTTVIISEKTSDWKYFFTYNSYILLLFSLLSFLLFGFYLVVYTSVFKTTSLTRRIQSIIIVLLLLALSSVAFISGSLVSKQFETDNKKQLSEKSVTITNELQAIFKPDALFNPIQKELINTKLKEYAHLFNTDISLYDAKGFLFNTSQSRLYELGLASNLVNKAAFTDLMNNQSSGICANEKAGNLNYLSYYSPLYNANKQIIGFLNLPYFAKQNDLTNELSNIISALINIYVILFVISIFVGLVLASYITRPLRLIQQQLSRINLGGKNETIVWQSNDEIGKLISEYNQMLLKLEQSANLLAQSERESAWREMAKQVAHEIKNPLTPMKLNLQYLQHVIKSDDENFKERFEKASNSIIEQIDTLANIATEFSNFAKLPTPELGSINITEVINSAVLLFQNNNEVTIINHTAGPPLFVKGDKDQALRVFNNLIKNAVQALETISDAKIEISKTEMDNSVVFTITDNGIGISPEIEQRLFTPNFTTKNTGSGLGLAIVKSSMQSFGGKVWFNKKNKTGASFCLEFIKL